MIGQCGQAPWYTLRRLALAARISPRDLRRTLNAAVLACLALMLLVPRAAMAEEPETPVEQPQQPPVTPASNDEAGDTEASQHLQDIDPAIVAADRFRHVTLLGNPFGLVVGRVSAEVQVMLALHHAIVLNPYVRVVDDFVLLTTSGRRELGYGAELGYRYFSGRRGAA